MMTVAERAQDLGLALEIIDGPEDRVDGDGWAHYAYRVAVVHENGRIETPWRQGLGITDDPGIESVVNSLAMDAASVENADGFDDWATELGFFPMESSDDYRKAREAWDACNATRDRLVEVLGPIAAEALMFETESQ